ncbi:hypothetical protein PVAG01_02098 [Phlyctema vagabunda]|uniref:Uncharacterized protein n=1 Tax=Phlyctema vagabunda TaxID=108571 RepID=A0ABR4PPM2_9HELO
MNLAELSDDGTIAVQCAIAGVAAIVVLGRVYMRTIYLSSSLNLSDYFVLGGLTISLGWCITTGLAQKSSRIRDAFNTDEKLSKGLQKARNISSSSYGAKLTPVCHIVPVRGKSDV